MSRARIVLGRWGHLGRRFATSLAGRGPAPVDEWWALRQLTPAERGLWLAMSAQDRRHSIAVARRYARRRVVPTRAELAGALLHDVGKRDSGLGTFGRVAATAVGPRTARFRRYHAHEAIGARMAASAGSDPVTVELVAGRGPFSTDLREADRL